jgi:imidazolonepropionase-like amidohydrolase
VALLILLLIALSGCQPADEGHSKAIIGAVLIDGAGGPPLADSVVIVALNQIQWTGPRTSADIPPGADKIDGSGKYLVPAPVDAYKSPDLKAAFTAPGAPPQGALQPTTPGQARQQVAALEDHKPGAIHIWTDGMPRPVLTAILDGARAAGIPVTGHFSTQEDARTLVDGGATRLVGMIRDTTNLDDDLLIKLRDLRVVVAPALSSQPASEIARGNTHRLFAAGVPIAVASSGGDLIHEAELLADAGIPPLDVIVAWSRGGGILPGKPAEMLLLLANPGQDVGNLRKTAKLW